MHAGIAIIHIKLKNLEKEPTKYSQSMCSSTRSPAAMSQALNEVQELKHNSNGTKFFSN